MENPINPTPNTNDISNSNPSHNSIDGLSRPTPSSSSDDAVVSSISISPDEQSSSAKPNDSTGNSNNSANSQSVPALAAPMSSNNTEGKKLGIWTFILIVLILIFFAGGVYGAYAYQQHKINNLNNQENSLSAQNASLKSQLSKLESSASVSINNQPSSNAIQTLFKITELGVAFTVPANLADLNYVVNTTHTVANLSTQNLTTLDSTCTATLNEAPLGSVEKVNGQYPTTSSSSTTLIKQYPTYYIAYMKPVGNCSTITQINSFTNYLVTDFKNTFSTIGLVTG